MFGRLTVLERVRIKDKYKGFSCWRCLCSCGKETFVPTSSLQRGTTTSCGCIRRQNAVAMGSSSRKHGASDTKLYAAWAGMKDRCYNRNGPGYKDYGGRGITVHESWRNDFEAFRRDVGEPPAGLSLDRIDNDRGYEPGNVRWATSLQQMRNRRTSWRLVDVNDQPLTWVSIAAHLAMSRPEAYRRLARHL